MNMENDYSKCNFYIATLKTKVTCILQRYKIHRIHFAANN
jgi:hypothetical protein